MKPESLNPKMSATADLWPREASFPRAWNANACFGSARREATRFFARHLACRVACCAVGGQGCKVLWSTTQAQIAERPHAWVVGHFQELVDDDSPVLFLARQGGNQGIRGSRNRTHERLGGDPVTAIEQGGFWCRPSETCVESDFDSSLLQQVLGEPRKGFGKLRENKRAGMKQDDTDLGRLDASKMARARSVRSHSARRRLPHPRIHHQQPRR